MSSWRAMAARGGDCDGQAMNVASSLPVILRRADGECPRRHSVTVRRFHTDPTADVRSLASLGRTAALSAR
jgi:hypothetical protein